MNKILKVVALSAALLAATGLSVSAQENGNRDADGKIVRGPYETGRFIDNTWISIAGGINLFENSPKDVGGVTPALDINIGKWLTPSVGLRLGYQGITASSWTNAQYPYFKEMGDDGRYKNVFNTMYIHGDVLWNVSNAFSGYKETRLWNFVPFLSAGVARSWKNGVYNNELAVGVGLLNNIRISNRVDLNLEVRQLVVKQGYDSSPVGGVAGMTSATFGVSVKLGKTGFVRSHTAEYASRISALEPDALVQKQADSARAVSRLGQVGERQIFCVIQRHGTSLPLPAERPRKVLCRFGSLPPPRPEDAADRLPRRNRGRSAGSPPRAFG